MPSQKPAKSQKVAAELEGRVIFHSDYSSHRCSCTIRLFASSIHSYSPSPSGTLVHLYHWQSVLLFLPTLILFPSIPFLPLVVLPPPPPLINIILVDCPLYSTVRYLLSSSPELVWLTKHAHRNVLLFV